ncbi:hypothetical protein ACFYTQ_35450 [Nocardia sp. NPDC004068]|uniref:hypothetical protein n=1 Tax=Nocardia sp. NPDC004068 TaxID=3364303 RepID=UPI0036B99750
MSGRIAANLVATPDPAILEAYLRPLLSLRASLGDSTGVARAVSAVVSATSARLATGEPEHRDAVHAIESTWSGQGAVAAVTALRQTHAQLAMVVDHGSQYLPILTDALACVAACRRRMDDLIAEFRSDAAHLASPAAKSSGATALVARATAALGQAISLVDAVRAELNEHRRRLDELATPAVTVPESPAPAPLPVHGPLGFGPVAPAPTSPASMSPLPRDTTSPASMSSVAASPPRDPASVPAATPSTVTTAPAGAEPNPAPVARVPASPSGGASPHPPAESPSALASPEPASPPVPANPAGAEGLQQSLISAATSLGNTAITQAGTIGVHLVDDAAGIIDTAINAAGPRIDKLIDIVPELLHPEGDHHAAGDPAPAVPPSQDIPPGPTRPEPPSPVQPPSVPAGPHAPVPTQPQLPSWSAPGTSDESPTSTDPDPSPSPWNAPGDSTSSLVTTGSQPCSRVGDSGGCAQGGERQPERGARDEDGHRDREHLCSGGAGAASSAAP